ncbi:MAG: hypothetical protein HY906_21485 [Deltaproteobacteria bacterium]|nr:hypothetical protein [Deltaproteobacteria bacterium]
MMARIPALVFAALLCGCVADNTQSLVITQNDVPEVSGNTCIAPAGESTTFRASGTLDISFFSGYSGYPGPSAGYLLFPAVKNNLSGSVAGTSITTNATMFTIEVNRVDVDLTDAGGASLTQPFSVPVYKVLEAGSVIGLAVDVVPAEVISSLYDGMLIFAKVKVVGNRDGSTIHSNTMQYPISVCDGCLFHDAGACVDFTGTGSANLCNIAQDEVAVCCEDSVDGLICPAVTETVSG